MWQSTGCRVPSRWRSRFHEGAQAQGGLAGSHSLPVGSRSESNQLFLYSLSSNLLPRVG